MYYEIQKEINMCYILVRFCGLLLQHNLVNAKRYKHLSGCLIFLFENLCSQHFLAFRTSLWDTLPDNAWLSPSCPLDLCLVEKLTLMTLYKIYHVPTLPPSIPSSTLFPGLAEKGLKGISVFILLYSKSRSWPSFIVK